MAVGAVVDPHAARAILDQMEPLRGPNTPAPVGNGMVGGSTAEGILNAAGTPAGGALVDTVMRQAAGTRIGGPRPRKAVGRRKIRREPDIDRDEHLLGAFR